MFLQNTISHPSTSSYPYDSFNTYPLIHTPKKWDDKSCLSSFFPPNLNLSPTIKIWYDSSTNRWLALCRFFKFCRGCSSAPPLIMKILSWSVCGLDNPRAFQVVKDIIRQCNHDIVFLSEIRWSCENSPSEDYSQFSRLLFNFSARFRWWYFKFYLFSFYGCLGSSFT